MEKIIMAFLKFPSNLAAVAVITCAFSTPMFVISSLMHITLETIRNIKVGLTKQQSCIDPICQ